MAQYFTEQLAVVFLIKNKGKPGANHGRFCGRVGPRHPGAEGCGGRCLSDGDSGGPAPLGNVHWQAMCSAVGGHPGRGVVLKTLG